MTNPERGGGLFTVGLYGLHDLTEQDRILLEAIRPSGVILFQRNIESGEQIDRFIEIITHFLGYKPLIAIDQEGGIVTRLTRGFTVAPGAMALAMTGHSLNAYHTGKILGREMKAVGIDWNLAPVVDINNNPDNPGIGIRSFGETREIVTSYAKEFVRGLEEEGILACLKHFPGKGRVAVDAHLDMPELGAEKAIILEEELYPYRNINAPSWMPSHVYYPALQSKKEPASVSKEILTGLVRDRMKYEGVLISDDMTMGAVTRLYSVEEGVKKSFYSGMDNLLICHDFERQMESFRIIIREIERNETARLRMEESLERISRLYLLRNGVKPSRDCLASENHTARMRLISREGIRILKNEEKKIPLKETHLIYAVKMTRKVQVENSKSPVLPVVNRLSELTGAPVRFIGPSQLEDISEFLLEAENKDIVLFSENAHLDAKMVTLITSLSRVCRSMVLCALRNPYDQFIEGVRNVICSFGYTDFQQEGLLDILMGK